MSLLEQISQTAAGKRTGIEMLHKLYLALNDDDTQAMIASFKADLESADPSGRSYVFGRVKSPISALKKFSEDPKYHTQWNRIKDLIAFTIVVDGDNDKVDFVREQLVRKYEAQGMQNPFASRISSDFMRHCVRTDPISRALYVYQDPSGRHYQTNDGYKSVKLNLMVGEYPIEVQIKTPQQLIAHCATHDAVYKASRDLFDGKTEEERDIQRHLVSDKMFPYFEAQAYLRLYSDTLSPEEKKRVRNDIKEIYQRNFEIYNKYAPVFKDAKADFAVHLFKHIHREEFESEKLVSPKNPLIDFSTYEVKKVFKYLVRGVKNSSPYLPDDVAISKAVDVLLVMPFFHYLSQKEHLRGQHRLDGCVLTGQFDGLNRQFIETLAQANEIFRSIHIKLYDDELARALTGRDTIFTVDQREFLIENCKYVKSVSAITDFKHTPVETLTRRAELVDEDPSGYQIISLTGVMDGCTLGHVQLERFANSLLDEKGKVIVGIKSDDYVKSHKNKIPVYPQEDRAAVYAGLRGVDKVYITNNDILPDAETCREMQEIIEKGGHCAVILGSDWGDPSKRATKPQSSIEEYEYLQENLPQIDLVPAPRRGGQEDFHTKSGKLMSSTSLRDSLIVQHTETMPIEFNELEEQ